MRLSEIEEAGDFTGFAPAVPEAPYLRAADAQQAAELHHGAHDELTAQAAPQPRRRAGRGRPALPGRSLTSALERRLAAEAAAERELAAVPDWLWDGETLPVPVETIADSHYGLLVREEHRLAEYAGLPDGVHISGLLFPAPREIWIDAGEAERAPVRRRFTIGHELGHWVLHCDPGSAREEPVYCRTETVREEPGEPARKGGFAGYPMTELDANQFAAAVLMPRALVEREHAWVDGVPWKLAQAFGVSVEAIEWRMRFLAGR